MSGRAGQVGKLAVGLRLGLLAEPVDPDDLQPELTRRSDIVEEAGRDVDVVLSIGGRQLEEAVPVSVRRLVRADVLGRDDEVDRCAQ